MIDIGSLCAGLVLPLWVFVTIALARELWRTGAIEGHGRRWTDRESVFTMLLLGATIVGLVRAVIA